MDFRSYIEQIPNITIAKRIAAAYVADYRRLNIDEIKHFLEKTAAQYTDAQNIATADELKAVAEQWSKKHPGEIFNLGYFRQNGRFDINLVKI